MPVNNDFANKTKRERIEAVKEEYRRMIDPNAEISQLGSGGFSDVMEVKCGENHYAVKFSDYRKLTEEMKGIVSEQYIRGRVIAETIFLSTVRNRNPEGSENIIRKLGNGTIMVEGDEFAFLEMELLESVDGSSIFHSETYALMMGIDISNALTCIHDDKLFDEGAHRDIKISNILYDSKQERFVLTDFNTFNRNMGKTKMDQTQIGTLETMAPEMSNGSGYSYKVDLYSLAASVYYLLNNGYYFKRADEDGKRQPSDNKEYYEGLSCCERLRDIIIRQMSYEKKDRPLDSAKAFKAEMLSILKEQCVVKYRQAEQNDMENFYREAIEYFDVLIKRCDHDDEDFSKLAICYFKIKEYDKAHEIFSRINNIFRFKGAAYYRGVMYENGWGTEKDLRQAATLYRHLAADGHPLAEGRLKEIEKALYEEASESTDFTEKRQKAFETYAPYKDNTILCDLSIYEKYVRAADETADVDEKIEYMEGAANAVNLETTHISYIADINWTLAELYGDKYDYENELKCYDRIIAAKADIDKAYGNVQNETENAKEKKPLEDIWLNFRKNDIITFPDDSRVRVLSTYTCNEKCYVYVKEIMSKRFEESDALLVDKKTYKVMEAFSDYTMVTVTDKEVLKQILPEFWKGDDGFDIVYQDENCAYAGEMRQGLPDGSGECRYVSGNIYIGEFKDGRRDGYGIEAYASGNSYDGMWRNDKKEGSGKLRWSSGAIYKGEFKSGVREGHGIVTYADGASYDGMWKNDEKEGLGEFRWPSGSIYKGDYSNGKRHGYGKMEWSNGDVYTGDWKNDHRNGEGICKYSDGGEYTGTWKNDKRHGEGRMKYAEEKKGNVLTMKFYRKHAVYDGEWSEGERHGWGVYEAINGDKYEGYWEHDKKHGKGTSKTAGGEIRNGIFENDKFIG